MEYMARGLVYERLVLRINWSGLTPILAANKDRGQGRPDYGDHTTGRRRWQKLLRSKSKSKLMRSRRLCLSQRRKYTHHVNEPVAPKLLKRERFVTSDWSGCCTSVTWLEQQSRPLLSCCREVLRRSAELLVKLPCQKRIFTLQHRPSKSTEPSAAPVHRKSWPRKGLR
jgi:hypothetical protein